MNRHARRSRIALAWIVALSLTTTAARADDDEAPATPVKLEPLHLKIFALKHRNPEEIKVLLSQIPTTEPVAPANALRVGSEPQKKSLFLRGSEKDIKRAETLLKAIDVPDEKIVKGDIEGLMLLPLKHAKPSVVSSVLSQLGVTGVRTLQLGKVSAFVFLSKDDNTKQFCEVVEALEELAKNAPVADPAVTASDDN